MLCQLWCAKRINHHLLVWHITPMFVLYAIYIYVGEKFRRQSKWSVSFYGLVGSTRHSTVYTLHWMFTNDFHSYTTYEFQFLAISAPKLNVDVVDILTKWCIMNGIFPFISLTLEWIEYVCIIFNIIIAQAAILVIIMLYVCVCESIRLCVWLLAMSMNQYFLKITYTE